MRQSSFLPLIIACVGLSIAQTGCDASGDEAEMTSPADAPVTSAVAQDEVPADLTEAAIATRDRIIEVAGTRSQRRLSRLANEFDGFQSNFGGADHFAYWYSRRRMGSDPNEAVVAIFDEPFAVRQVGDEFWYIWPDLATLDPEGFTLDQLSFRDRARLERLIGERGVEALLRGEPYPGYRTAITDSGRWVYFVDGN